MNSEAVLMAARIVELAPHFEIPALVDALRALGYGEGDIRFRSHPTTAHSAALIRSVSFEHSPRRAIVEVSVGLLSSQGPLPTYFWALLSEQHDAAMTEMMWFFDEHLLAQRFAALHPERDAKSLPGWDATRRSLLLLARLPSPSGVHWLLERLFPELTVQVRRCPGERSVRTGEFDIGNAQMGNGCTLGGVGVLPATGVEVLLVLGDEEIDNAAAWIEIIQKRLIQLVLPILVEQNPYLYLRLSLVLRRPSGQIKLSRDRHVGINRMDRAGDASIEPETLVLWVGEVRHALSSERLNFQLAARDDATSAAAVGSRTVARKEDRRGNTR